MKKNIYNTEVWHAGNRSLEARISWTDFEILLGSWNGTMENPNSEQSAHSEEIPRRPKNSKQNDQIPSSLTKFRTGRTNSDGSDKSAWIPTRTTKFRPSSLNTDGSNQIQTVPRKFRPVRLNSDKIPAVRHSEWIPTSATKFRAVGLKSDRAEKIPTVTTIPTEFRPFRLNSDRSDNSDHSD